MAEPATLGARIRERRLALGFSLGQLAVKVGKTAASVRAWERGEELPDAATLADLGDALELELSELEQLASRPAKPVPSATRTASPKEKVTPEAAEPDQERAKQAPPTQPPGRAQKAPAPRPAATDERATVMGQSEVFVAFDAPAVAEAPPQVAKPVGATPAASGAITPAAPARPAPPTDAGAAAAAPQRAAVPSAAATTPGPTADRRRQSDIADGPTEAIDVPVGGVRVSAEVRPSEPAPYQPLTNPLTALLDPDKRWLYWIRTTLTTIVLLVFFLVLVWASRELFGALGDVLDSFGDATETTTTLP